MGSVVFHIRLNNVGRWLQQNQDKTFDYQPQISENVCFLKVYKLLLKILSPSWRK